MKNEYRVELVQTKPMLKETKLFIEKWHYSKSARSQKQTYIFHLYDSLNKLIGVAIIGQPISRKYNSSEYGELRRLCLIDETFHCAESFFIGAVLRWLKKNSKYKFILSYSDPNVGHKGTIYKASNFKYLGKTKSPNPRVLLIGQKIKHQREVYQKRNGEYTNSAKYYQNLFRTGKAKFIEQKPKDTFIYKL